MIIKKAEFKTSVASRNNIIIDERKQIAFVGRSNVGKSSLLNFLVGKKLAKTSSTPGRTRLINYFSVNEDLYFVDLPGYGFAKGNKQEVGSWDDLIEPYLVENEQLKCICLLVDSRHEPMESDKQMAYVLNYYKIPYIVIATKCDKLPKTKQNAVKNTISSALGLGRENVIISSVDNRIGRTEILDKLDIYLNVDNEIDSEL